MDTGGYLYDGNLPPSYDTAALPQCRDASIGIDARGNPAAVWRSRAEDPPGPDTQGPRRVCRVTPAGTVVQRRSYGFSRVWSALTSSAVSALS